MGKDTERKNGKQHSQQGSIHEGLLMGLAETLEDRGVQSACGIGLRWRV